MKKGRGVFDSPRNRFEKYHYEDESEDGEGDKTSYIEVFQKTIVNKVSSPDVGMDYSLNPYQGCEHGCSYCYARPTHEYWGYNSGIDFEKTVLVKKNAPQLLRETFERKNWEVKPIVLSGNTDCYQPIERKLEITRSLLQVFLEYRHPVGIITKNAMVLRDLDLISELNELGLIAVNISLTTLDETLRRKLEPRTSSVNKRLNAIELLSGIGVPVNVMFCPVIPGLNDHEILPVAKIASEHGAKGFHSHIVRLMGQNGQLFENWLDAHYPERKNKVMNQIKELHQGKTGSSEFGLRGKGVGPLAANLRQQREIAKRKYFPDTYSSCLRTDLFRRAGDIQLGLF